MRLVPLSFLLLAACTPAPSPSAPEAPPTAPTAPSAAPTPRPAPAELPCARALLAAPEPTPPGSRLGPRVVLDLNTPAAAASGKVARGKGVDLGRLVLSAHLNEDRPSLLVELSMPGLPREALGARLEGKAQAAWRSWDESRERVRSLLLLRARAEPALAVCKAEGCEPCLRELEARLPTATHEAGVTLGRHEAALREALKPGDGPRELLLSFLADQGDSPEPPPEVLEHGRAAIAREPASTELGSFARLWVATHERDDKAAHALLSEVIASSPSLAHRAHARWELAGRLGHAEAAKQLAALGAEATTPELAAARLLALWRLVFAEAALDHGEKALEAAQRLLALPTLEPDLALALAPALGRALRSAPEGKRRIELPAALLREVALWMASERSGTPRALALAALRALPASEKNPDAQRAEADLVALDKGDKARARDAVLRLSHRCLMRQAEAPLERLQVKLRPGRGGLEAALEPALPAARSCLEGQARAYLGDDPAPTAIIELRWSP